MLNLNYNVIGSQRDTSVRAAGLPFQDFFAEVLTVAGGGRGGIDIGGGGGAGGYKYQSGYLIKSNGFYTVAIGAGQPSWFTTGGVCGADPPTTSLSGSNTFVLNSVDGSNFFTMGGGAAGCGGILGSVFPASNGGSGGGGQGFGGAGGNGFVDAQSFIQGNNGGAAASDPTSKGGGGGGAAFAGNTLGTGIGGNGRLDLSLPTGSYRAGGGIGAGASTTSGSLGGGGYFGIAGSRLTENGQPNTGGGGGALQGVVSSGSIYDTGAGGSGFAQFRYPGPQRANGGVVYEEKNIFGDVLFTVHTFTASGVFEPIR